MCDACFGSVSIYTLLVLLLSAAAMTHFPHRLNQLSTDLITFGVVVNTDWHPQNSLYQMLLTDPQYSHHTWRIASPCFVCWWSDDVQNLSCEFILWGTDKIRACQTDFCVRFSDGCSSDMLIFTEAGGFRTKVTLATVMFRTRPACCSVWCYQLHCPKIKNKKLVQSAQTTWWVRLFSQLLP